MAVIVRIVSATGSTRTFILQDGQELPAVTLAPGDRVDIVERDSAGIALVMDGNAVEMNWTGDGTAMRFENLALYLQQQNGSQIVVVDQNSGTTTRIASIEDLLAGFATAAGGTQGDAGGGPGLTNSGAIDEQGLEAGGGTPLGLDGGIGGRGLPITPLAGGASEESSETANSAPASSGGADSGTVTELADGSEGENVNVLTTSGVFAFTDSDTGDAHTVTVAPQGGGIGYLGTLSATVSDESTGDGTGEITWTFTVGDAAVDFLGAGETLVQTYDVTVSDGQGGTTVRTVTVTIVGSADAPVVEVLEFDAAAGATIEIVDGEVGENESDRTASGTLSFTDTDLTDSHVLSVTPGNEGYLGGLAASIASGATGGGVGTVAWSFGVNDAELDFLAEGETRVQTYTVGLDDGEGGVTTQDIVITVTGTNDDPAIGAATGYRTVTELADGAVNENAADLTAQGTIAFADVDLADVHTVSVTPRGPDYLGTLSATMADDATGDGDGTIGWSFRVNDGAVDHLGAGETLVQTYDVEVADGHGGTATKTLQITIAGTNDGPDAATDRVVTNILHAPIEIPIADILLNDSDADGDPLTVTSVSAVGGGSAHIDPERGVIVFEPCASLDDGDRATIRYTLSDGNGGEAQGTIELTADHCVINAAAGYKQIVIAGSGGDTAYAGDGDDIVHGNAGNDELHGGTGSDALFGGPGGDVLFGDGGDDALSGGDGKDFLFGGGRNDALDGGNGNDHLAGGDGDDVLFGGSGADRFVLERGDLHHGGDWYADTIQDFQAGDTLDLRDVVDWLASGNASAPASGELAFEQHGADTWVVTTDGRPDVGGSAGQAIVIIEATDTGELQLDQDGNITKA